MEPTAANSTPAKGALKQSRTMMGMAFFAWLPIVILLISAVALVRYSFFSGSAEAAAVRQALYSSHELAFEASQLTFFVSSISDGDAALSLSQLRSSFEKKQQRLMSALLNSNGWLTPRSLSASQAQALRQGVETTLVAHLNTARKIIAAKTSIEQLQSSFNPSMTAIEEMQQRLGQLKQSYESQVYESQEAMQAFIRHLRETDRELTNAEAEHKTSLTGLAFIVLAPLVAI